MDEEDEDKDEDATKIYQHEDDNEASYALGHLGESVSDVSALPSPTSSYTCKRCVKEDVDGEEKGLRGRVRVRVRSTGRGQERVDVRIRSRRRGRELRRGRGRPRGRG